MTNEEHNKYIAWAFLVNGAFQVAVFGFIFLIVFAAMLSGPDGRDFPAGLFAAIFGFVFIVNLAFQSPNFIAAYALLKRKPWARVAGIVAAALSVMNIPFGTLAGVYSLWFFCGEQWKDVYPESGRPLRSGPYQLDPHPQSEWEGYSRGEEGAYTYRTPPPPDWR